MAIVPAEGTTLPGLAGQRDSMHRDENHSSARRRAGVLAVAAGIVLLAAACGGSPSSVAASGSPASAGDPSASAAGTSQAGTSAQSQQLAFAKCMRTHGIPDFPDSGGRLTQGSPGSDLNPHDPAYRAALRACQSLLPSVRLSPAQAAQANADALKFSACMRAHGVTNYPDPQGGSGSNNTINLTGIDLNSPQFQAAQQTCSHLLGPNPDGKG